MVDYALSAELSNEILALTVSIFTSRLLVDSSSTHNLYYETLINSRIVIRLICLFEDNNSFAIIACKKYGIHIVAIAKIDHKCQNNICSCIKKDKIVNILIEGIDMRNRLGEHLDVLDVFYANKEYTLMRLMNYARQLTALRSIFQLKLSDLLENKHLFNDFSEIQYRIEGKIISMLINLEVKTIALQVNEGRPLARTLKYNNKRVFDASLFMLSPSTFITTVIQMYNLAKNKHWQVHNPVTIGCVINDCQL